MATVSFLFSIKDRNDSVGDVEDRHGGHIFSPSPRETMYPLTYLAIYFSIVGSCRTI